MTTAVDVVEKARSQIGTLIGTPGVPYAVPFSCAKFTSWVLRECGITYYEADGPNVQLITAQQRGEFTTTPSVGDLVFIDLMGRNNEMGVITHVAIVIAVDANGTTTIEFNDPESGPNVVKYHARALPGDGYTIGYAHLPYEKGPIVVAQRYHIPNVFVDLRAGTTPAGIPWALTLGEDGGVFAEGPVFHGSEVNHPEFGDGRKAAVLHVMPDGSAYTIEDTAGELYRPDGGHPFRIINGQSVPS